MTAHDAATTDAPPASTARPGPGWTASALLVLVGAYRALSAGRTPRCRFIPSCSEYAVEALNMHGARRALVLVARRLSHCRPGGGFGYDPVPPAAGAVRRPAAPADPGTVPVTTTDGSTTEARP